MEDGYDSLVLHAAVGDYGVEDVLTVEVDVGELVPRDLLQEFGYGEEGTGGEPAGDVIAHDVVAQGFGRNLEYVFVEFAQVMYSHYLLHGLGVAEDEVAEAEVLGEDLLDVVVHLLGVLIDKAGAAHVGIDFAFDLAGIEDEGYVLIDSAYGLQELVACEFVFLFVACIDRETAVGDDSEHIVAVTAVEEPCLFVAAGKDYLRTSAHAQHLELGVECLGGEEEALLEYEFIEVGEDGGVEPDAVFDEEYHLYACGEVVFEVHLILDKLDDGEQEVGVAEPAEDVFEGTEVFVLHALRDTVGEGCEDDDGDVGELCLDVACDVEDVVVVGTRHTDDEVEAVLTEQGNDIALCGGTEETGRVAQSEFGVFVEYLLIDASVVFKHEGIVGVGYDEDVEDATLHEVDEVGVTKLNHLFWV